MSYIVRPPRGRLVGIVERFWRVEDAQPGGTPEIICPDGCAEIVLHLGDAMDGQPHHLLVGQMQEPLSVRATGRVLMLGARFTPFGLYHLLPAPQDRFVGCILPLDSVWRAWPDRAADRIASAANPEKQMEVFADAIEALLPDGSSRDGERVVEAAVRRMRARGGPVCPETMAAAGGISRRQFERRFRERVGLAPHLFGRLVRFQHAFAALPHEPGAAVAARLGYADQAHMVREIRRFSGQTPTLLAGADGLTSFFSNPAAG